MTTNVEEVPVVPTVLRAGGATIVLDMHTISVNGELVRMTNYQNRLLRTLVEWATTNKHRKMRKIDLCAALKGRGGQSATINVHLSRLRTILKAAHPDASGIIASKNGYCWVRRECFVSDTPNVPATFTFIVGDAEIVLDESRFLSVNETTIPAAAMEIKHFGVLAEHAGEVCDKVMMLRSVYGEPKAWPDPKILDVMMCKLRKKLAAAHPDAGRLIQTMWGRGYYIQTSPAESLTIAGTKSGQRARSKSYRGMSVNIDDLPPNDCRWTIARKMLLVGLVHHEIVTLPELLARYPALTQGEIDGWRTIIEAGDMYDLRVSRIAA